MRTIRIAITDLVSNSYFPVLAAEELGFYRAEGIDGRVELVMPLSDAYERLKERSLRFVADGVHDSFVVWPRWNGLKALMTLQQGTPWLLVLRSELEAPRGDLEVLKGRRIAAALGPDYAFKRLLSEVGLDEARDRIDVCKLPGAEAAGISYGVTAARALDAREVDGFWANAMGAAVAVHRGAGRIHMDVRRGDGPETAKDYSFGALITTAEVAAGEPDLVAAVVRAVVAAQKALREDPTLAAQVGERRFPAEEAGLITDLVRRDSPFYDPSISERSVTAMMDFAHAVGLISEAAPYEEVVATEVRLLWAASP